MARLLQDEENARTATSASSTTISLMQMQAPNRHSSVPGWSNQNPSWMTQTGNRGLSKADISVNISQGNEHFRPHSVADTLRQLRGSQGSRAQFHKFQHRKSGSVKSGNRFKHQVHDRMCCFVFIYQIQGHCYLSLPLRR